MTSGVHHVPRPTTSTACPFMPVFGPPQVMFVRGRGTELWDVDGQRYLDFLGGLAVIGLGHANPAVAEAIAAQAGELLHVSNLFANPVATRAAIEVDRLLAEATGHEGQVFFTNSGAEAVECAIKLARKHGGRGRHVVVSALGSFHGRTLAALAATGQPTKHEPFQPMPEGFRHVAWGDVDAVDKAVDASVAAVLVEPLQGEGGVNPAPDGYLAAHPRDLRRDRRADDGRRDPDRVRPHRPLVRLPARRRRPGRRDDGQGDGQRHARRRLLGPPRRRRRVRAGRPRQHVQRHGDRHRRRQRRDRRDAPHRRAALAASKGQRLAEALGALPGVASVRGRGLLLAAELDGSRRARGLPPPARRGLVVNAVTPTALRLAPPLTVSDGEIDEAVDADRQGA